MGWRRWHLGGILIGAIAAIIRKADLSPIDDDLGGDSGCLKVAGCRRSRPPVADPKQAFNTVSTNDRLCPESRRDFHGLATSGRLPSARQEWQCLLEIRKDKSAARCQDVRFWRNADANKFEAEIFGHFKVPAPVSD